MLAFQTPAQITIGKEAIIFCSFSGDLLTVKLAYSSRPQHQTPPQPNIIDLQNYAAITLTFRRGHRP
jgi:hypothetical protein